MNDNPQQPKSGAGNGAADADEGLEQLRRLLLAPEQRGISEIRRRLDDPESQAQDMSRVLPSAMRMASARDDQMASAIMPAVERALGESVKRNPRILTDTIFPVIGPAIRKAISEAFAKLTQTLNQTLNHSLSVQGLKWRIEAFRTGKTFADVVLARTLIYRVEHVFLIHAKTGLLLQHAQAHNVTSRDPEMIAGMLTAIEDFTHDSFDNMRSGERLEAFDVGDLHVWIENGPRAKIAAVIRGNAPLELRTKLQIAQDRIHAEQAQTLTDFKGDAEPFEASRPALDECLVQQVQDGGATNGKPLIWIAAILGFALLTWIAFAIYKGNRQRTAQRQQAAEHQQAQLALERAITLEKERDAKLGAQWQSALARLREEPGIVVTESAREGATYRIGGLRDPLAAEPSAILTQAGIGPTAITARWEPYFALHPSIILQRAKSRLEPPQGVTLDLQEDVLLARGTAPASWIDTAHRRAGSVPGISRFDASGLTDETDQILAAKRKGVESANVSFSDGLTLTPESSAELSKIAAQIEDLRRTASVRGSTLNIKVIGHTSPEGPEQLNSALAKNRADEIVRMLVASGIKPGILASEGTALSEAGNQPDDAQAARRLRRSVTFHVTISAGSPTKNIR